MPFQKGHKGFRKIYYPLSEKIKEKISQANKGKIAWNKGIKNSTGIKPWAGKKRSPETIEKIRNNRKGKSYGSKHWNWKNGIMKHEGGYIMIFKPEHPFCNKMGYVRKSHLVMEEKLGRYLTKKEIIHHKDKNTSNDKIENLELFKNNGEHIRYHRLISPSLKRRVKHKREDQTNL